MTTEQTPPEATAQAGPLPDDVTSEIPSLVEKATYEVYAATVKDAVKSTDEAAAATVTAAFSIATAYGALVALATPTARPTTLPLVWPIFGFIGAALVALWGRSRVLGMSSDLGVANVASQIVKHTKAKRRYLRSAVALLAGAVALAAWIVVENYNPPAAADTATATTIHVILEE